MRKKQWKKTENAEESIENGEGRGEILIKMRKNGETEET